MNGVARRHRLLLMLDEFAALGRLDFFETALAFQAGYGVRAYRISGDSPPWRPVQVFDDTHKVYIQFPPGIAQGDTPPLFITARPARPS